MHCFIGTWHWLSDDVCGCQLTTQAVFSLPLTTINISCLYIIYTQTSQTFVCRVCLFLLNDSQNCLTISRKTTEVNNFWHILMKTYFSPMVFSRKSIIFLFNYFGKAWNDGGKAWHAVFRRQGVIRCTVLPWPVLFTMSGQATSTNTHNCVWIIKVLPNLYIFL